MLISVITATHNRATTLPAVYHSIAEQDVDVEWVVVDDGSTDDTPELLTDLARQAEFPVRFMRQPHLGKHVAHNRAIAAARGEMAALIDSDDQLLPGGLARLLERWHEIPVPRRDGFVSVTGRAIDHTGRPIGNAFPGPTPIDCTWHDAIYVHRATGDRCGLLRTDVLRAHPFPEPDGRWFVTESTVWREIGKRYIARYVDDTVELVNTGGADRICRRPFADRAAAMHAECAQVLSQDLPWFRHAPESFFRSAIQYVRGGLHERVPLRRQAATLPAPARALWAGAVPFGTALWLYDRRSAGAI